MQGQRARHNLGLQLFGIGITSAANPAAAHRLEDLLGQADLPVGGDPEEAQVARLEAVRSQRGALSGHVQIVRTVPPRGIGANQSKCLELGVGRDVQPDVLAQLGGSQAGRPATTQLPQIGRAHV